jgi:hypothetical protein
MFFCAISNSRFYCNFTSNVFISLSMLFSLCNFNKLCNKQQVVKASNTKDTCKPILVRNFMKVFFLKCQKHFPTYWPHLCVMLCKSSKTICCPSSYDPCNWRITFIAHKVWWKIMLRSCIVSYKQTMVFNISIWYIFAQHLQIVYSS